jgi:hypothetical protein
MDQPNQYCENNSNTESNMHVQCHPHQNSNDILHRDRKINIEVHSKAQKTSNSQRNPKKSTAEGITISDLKP